MFKEYAANHRESGWPCPGVRQFQLIQAVVIPPFTLEAIKATVLNRFGFRQTDSILCLAIRKHATPLNFNQQRSPRKTKALSTLRFGHDSCLAIRTVSTTATRFPQIQDAVEQYRQLLYVEL